MEQNNNNKLLCSPYYIGVTLFRELQSRKHS